MAEGDFDIAICGSTPFAGLLAGLLASVHKKRVCLVGEPWSPYRLTRGFDLSVMPSARPETWLMLKRGGPETLKLIASIGKGLVERIDPLFVAELPASADYLSHMRWMAHSIGFAAERAVERTLTENGSVWRMRDASLLVAGKAEPAIEAWLGKLNIVRFSTDTAINANKDGGYLLRAGQQELKAQSVVLADDESILSRLSPAERHRLTTTQPRITLMTESVAKPVPASFVHWLDRGVTIHQRQGKTPVSAIAAGEADTALPRIGASLPGGGRLRRTAQARFRTVETIDGAPLIGQVGRAKFMVIAGLGASAAFFAPMLARSLAGTASEDEARYVAAHDAGKAAARAAVAETSVTVTSTEPEAAA